MAQEKYQHKPTDHPDRHVSWHNNQVRASLADAAIDEWLKSGPPFEEIVDAAATLGNWDDLVKDITKMKP